MLRNPYGRRIVVAGWARAQQIHAATASERDELRAQFAAPKREHEELLQLLRETTALVREARQESEQRVAELPRERDIARARAAERDPALPLH